MSYAEIILEVADGIAQITLNRPERLNAYTPTMGRELHEAFGECDADDAVRAIIVTGAGRGFCAGADLARGGESFDRAAAAEYQGKHPDRPWEKPRRAVAPWDVRKPIIAAINGAAVGVGATLPMQWDIRLAAESAKIGFVFVRRGVVPEALSTWTVPRLVGMARAAELLLTGRLLGAREALEFGLVSRVVPDAELLPAACVGGRDRARDSPRVGGDDEVAPLVDAARDRPRTRGRPRRARLLVDRDAARRARGRARLPREAPAGLGDAAEHRHAGLPAATEPPALIARRAGAS
jgi:enoyl-CoA hydratase/carnithine racemase